MDSVSDQVRIIDIARNLGLPELRCVAEGNCEG